MKRLKIIFILCVLSMTVYAQDSFNYKLIYCSCSRTNHGLPAGEIQRSYYELIADEGTAPKVVYCEIRDDEPEKTEYPATEKDVSDLYQNLHDMGAFDLDGYHVEESMTGGSTYRIYMEFSNGSKVNATWFTHSPKRLAVEAYAVILSTLRGIAK